MSDVLVYLERAAKLSCGRSFTIEECEQIEEAMRTLDKALAPCKVQAWIELDKATEPWTEC